METTNLLKTVIRFTLDCPGMKHKLDRLVNEAFQLVDETQFMLWMAHLIELGASQEQLEADICEMDMYNDWSDPTAQARYYATWAMTSEFNQYIVNHIK